MIEGWTKEQWEEVLNRCGDVGRKIHDELVKTGGANEEDLWRSVAAVIVARALEVNAHWQLATYQHAVNAALQRETEMARAALTGGPTIDAEA